jgi:hypothetical protein
MAILTLGVTQEAWKSAAMSNCSNAQQSAQTMCIASKFLMAAQ